MTSSTKSRIMNILTQPHKIPGKIFNRIQEKQIKSSYDYSLYEREQKDYFKALGLNYNEAEKELKELYERFPQLNYGMASQHHHLFVALSLKHNFKNILEIGTHSAQGTELFSRIFPDAQIDSLDLPDDHPIFKETYLRETEGKRQAFIKERNDRLNSLQNVTYIQKDSSTLTLESKQYDLIWVDGAHGYPQVCMDITNAVRLLSAHGVMACDDVWTSIKKSDGMYSSIASYETIKQFKDAGLIDFKLIHKRLIAPFAHPKHRKFIAVLNRL